ncbi:MAG: TIGR00289 family protein [Candidatus Bathyarchaeota archaeon]|jgi:predicted ATP pyrophosphatase (TIGR00289 family)
MRVAVLATAGKDSTLALHQVIKEDFDVHFLVSMIPQRRDSWMFHYPNMHLIDYFAEAVEIPLVKAETSGIKEREVEDLESLIAKLDVQGLVSGAVASNYQKTRIERVCKKLGLESIMPLWHKDEMEILNEILNLRFETIITAVSAYGFSEEWLGTEINRETVEALMELNRRYGVSLVGEGGEYETFVLDASFFNKRIEIVEVDKVWEKENGYLIIREANLKKK